MIDFTKQGKPVYVRMLSHMVTGCVVWFDIETRSILRHEKRAPIYSSEMDYVTYEGLLDVETFQKLFKEYSLTYTLGDKMFSVNPLADEYRDMIRFTRAKCFALSTINNFAIRNLERNGVTNHPLLDPNIDMDIVTEIYQRRMNIDSKQARKLIEFHQNEHLINLKNIRHLHIEAELAINNARTIEEIISQFITSSGEMGVLGARTDNITRLL